MIVAQKSYCAFRNDNLSQKCLERFRVDKIFCKIPKQQQQQGWKSKTYARDYWEQEEEVGKNQNVFLFTLQYIFGLCTEMYRRCNKIEEEMKLWGKWEFIIILHFSLSWIAMKRVWNVKSTKNEEGTVSCKTWLGFSGGFHSQLS